MNGLEVRRAFLSSIKRSGSNSSAVYVRRRGRWAEQIIVSRGDRKYRQECMYDGQRTRRAPEVFPSLHNVWCV